MATFDYGSLQPKPSIPPFPKQLCKAYEWYSQLILDIIALASVELQPLPHSLTVTTVIATTAQHY